jgi:hypothetical protein
LLHTLDGIDKVLDVVHDLTVDGIELIDEIVGNETLVFSDTEDVLGAVNGLCPEIRFPICTDTRDPDSCNFDNITLNGDVLLDFVRLALDAGSLVDEELLKSRADLVDLQETTENMRDFGDVSENKINAERCPVRVCTHNSQSNHISRHLIGRSTALWFFPYCWL